jgi:TetR/AcrR family transcriptional regulator
MTTARNSIKKVAAGRRPKAARQDMGTRMAILKAARAVFARRGFEGASTREVAEAAGVNNAMIYYHFKDKLRLYRAVLSHSFAEYERIWKHPIFASDAPSRDKIRTYIEGYIRFQHANDELRRILSMEFASCSKNYAWLADHYFVHNYEMLAGLLRQGMRSGELRKIDLSLAIPSLVGVINQSFILRPITEHIVGKKLDLAVRRFGGFVTHLFFEGLQGKQIT